MSVIAGIMISIGCVCYLTIGGVAGAVLFSVGLMSVVLYKMPLFTGRAGWLAENKITPIELCKIWIGNLCGTYLLGLIVSISPLSATLRQSAQKIMESREAIGPLYSLLLAIPCGLLMYLAVSAPDNPMKLLFVGLCVAGFILGGFYHCVADMFYTWIGSVNWA